MRGLSLATLLIFIAGTFAPAFIALDFLVERDRIMTELCVQRLVPEDVRTCHGQCYLMRTLNEVEKKAKDLPGELRSYRLDDATLTQGRLLAPVRTAMDVVRPTADATASDGFAPLNDPVPWC